MGELMTRHIVLNERADYYAKQGAKVHPSPSEEISARWADDLANLKSYAKLMIILWPLWPKLTKVEPRPNADLQLGRAKTRRPRGNTNPGAPKHCWTFGCGRWQCSA
eukprot:4451350-Heterocapsa_arctica.AAC.1